MKKIPGDIIIVHKCTKSHDHMLCCSWDMAGDRCKCHFSFWAIFCPFTLRTAQKIKLKKMKKIPGDIIILHRSTKNYYHMLYCSWDMMCDRCNYYFSFWAIFCPFTPLTTQKMKIKKKWKKYLEISSFYICVPKIMIRWYMVPEIWCTTEGWTDGRTEKGIYRSGCIT